MKFIGNGMLFVVIMFLGVLSALQLNIEPSNVQNKPVIENTEEKSSSVQTDPRVFSKVGEDFSNLVQKSVEITVEPVLTKLHDVVSGK